MSDIDSAGGRLKGVSGAGEESVDGSFGPGGWEEAARQDREPGDSLAGNDAGLIWTDPSVNGVQDVRRSGG